MKTRSKIVSAASLAILLAGCGSAQDNTQAGGLGQYSSTTKDGNDTVVSTQLWADPSTDLVQRTDRALATMTDGYLAHMPYAYVRTDNTKGGAATVVNSVKVTTDSGETIELRPAFKVINETCDQAGEKDDVAFYNKYCIALGNELAGDLTGVGAHESRSQLYVANKPIPSVKKVDFVVTSRTVSAKKES